MGGENAVKITVEHERSTKRQGGNEDNAYAQTLLEDEKVVATCDRVIDIFSALFEVPGREIRSASRGEASVSRARQIAMYVVHTGLHMSMRDVAAGFSRSRGSVVYACHLIEDMRDDLEFDRIVSIAERVVCSALGPRDGRI